MNRICFVRQNYFPLDPRLKREVDAVVGAGYSVDVLCLRDHGERRFERNGAVTVFRLPPRRRRAGTARYLYEYGTFFVLVAVLGTLLQLIRRYRVIQVCNLPDALVFATVPARLLGARVVLDLYEPMPEFFVSRFKASFGHPVVRLLCWLERQSIRYADRALTCTEQMRQAFVSRGAPAQKIAVVLNSSNEEVFNAERVRAAGSGWEPKTFVLISHGTVEERYGLDTTVRAVALLRDEMPDLRFRVVGNGAYRDELRRLVDALDLTNRVTFSDGFVPIEDLLTEIASADTGVVALKRDPFRDICHCNKMFDFISMRKPAIVSRTASVQSYFPDGCFLTFGSDDAEELAGAIRALRADPALGARLVERATQVNEPYRWIHQRAIYQQLIADVIASKPTNQAPVEPRVA